MILADGAKITELDKLVGNGIVHRVDSVLYPPEITLYEYLARDSRFQDLFTSLVLAELVKPLENVSAHYTIFAPDNDAFLTFPGGLANALQDPVAFERMLLLSHLFQCLSLLSPSSIEVERKH